MSSRSHLWPAGTLRNGSSRIAGSGPPSGAACRARPSRASSRSCKSAGSTTTVSEAPPLPPTRPPAERPRGAGRSATSCRAPSHVPARRAPQALALPHQLLHIGLDEVGGGDVARVGGTQRSLLLLEASEVGVDLVRRPRRRAGLVAPSATTTSSSAVASRVRFHRRHHADRVAEVVGLHLERESRARPLRGPTACARRVRSRSAGALAPSPRPDRLRHTAGMPRSAGAGRSRRGCSQH